MDHMLRGEIAGSFSHLLVDTPVLIISRDLMSGGRFIFFPRSHDLEFCLLRHCYGELKKKGKYNKAKLCRKWTDISETNDSDWSRIKRKRKEMKYLQILKQN